MMLTTEQAVPITPPHKSVRPDERFVNDSIVRRKR